jgi:hypothetical protein
MKKKRIAVFSLVFIFLVLPGLYFLRIYPFLAYNSPVQPDVLVVEGWLPDEVINEAYTEFHASHYRYIITTGFPYFKGFRMGSMGELRFNINEQEFNPDSALSIIVRAKGTQAFKEYPHFKLYADSVLLYETYTKSKTCDYTFTGRISFRPATIILEFDNDAYDNFHDRNLIVYSISVNNTKYDVNAGNVAYYTRSNGMKSPFTELNISTAHEMAALLSKKGIPDSLIFPVGSFRKIKSRTYSSGYDVNIWLMKNSRLNIKSITVLTSGSHARRSYLSYRKAIQDKSIAVGVISCYDPVINEKNWWKTRRGVKEIMHETIGYLYVKFFL